MPTLTPVEHNPFADEADIEALKRYYANSIALPTNPVAQSAYDNVAVPVAREMGNIARGAGIVAKAPYNLFKDAWNNGSLIDPAVEGFKAPGRALDGYYSGMPNDYSDNRPQTPEEAREAIIGGAGATAGLAAAGSFPRLAMGAGKGEAGVFGGRLAATADHVKLAKAEKMEKAGDSPTEIWDATGWFKGKDDKWRFEIPDYTSRLKLGEKTTLGEKLDHPELYKAYPDLKDIETTYTTRPGTASYQNNNAFHPPYPDFERINLPEITAISGPTRSLTLHEIQHAIQTREGFAPGGNSDAILPFAKQLSMSPIRTPTENHLMNETANTVYGKSFHELSGDQQAVLLAHEAYKRLAGEVEARNVQARATRPPSELKDLPPNFTQDRTNAIQTVMSQRPTVNRSTDLPQPTFYSAVERAVQNAKQPVATSDQWLGFIKNQGVKAEELEHMGLENWLKEQKGSVTKQQVEDFIGKNKVELKEVNKGEMKFNENSKYNLPAVKKAIREAGDNPGELELTLANDGDAYRALTKKFPELSGNEDWARVVANDFYGGDSKPSGTTKYEKWQLPGATNYRETLLTLPPAKVSNEQAIKIAKDFTDSAGYEWNKLSVDKQQEWIKAAREQLELGKGPNDFRSSHWDEPNHVVHYRTNDRTIGNVKSLHIEEVQSDWHQKGRKEGYKLSPEMEKKLEPEFNKIEEKIVNSGDEAIMGHPDIKEAVKMAIDKKIITPVEGQIYLRYSDSQRSGAVPDAPFKKSWDDVAWKHIIRKAVDEGKDAISWTPGQKQAERYDLSKHIEKLKYNTETKRLTGLKDGSTIVLDHKKVEPDKLSEFVGKDIAERLLNKPTRINDGSNILEGLDLKIGGEFHKHLYDTQFVNRVNNIAKKYGGKVEEKNIEIPPKKDFILDANGIPKLMNYENQPVHFLRITPELRAAAKKGFPLFSGGVPILTPVDHDPYVKN